MQARYVMVIMLAVSSLLAGCGQKGPLYREPSVSVIEVPQSDDGEAGSERQQTGTDSD